MSINAKQLAKFIINKKLVQLILITCFSILEITPLVVYSLKPNISYAQDKQSETKFKTYTYKNKFSIQHPSGWFIYENEDRVVIQNLAMERPGGDVLGSDAIGTQIYIYHQSFENVTKETIRDYEIKRKGRLTIGGREALRLWTTNESTGGTDIITIVRYQTNQTFFIVSYTNELNSSTVEIIQRLHWSFRVIE